MKKFLFYFLLGFLSTFIFLNKGFGQPVGEWDPFSIWKDGTSTTTASIPFAEGLSVPFDKLITFGAAGLTSIGVDTLLTGTGLTFTSTDPINNKMYFASGGDMQFNSSEDWIGYANGEVNFTGALGFAQFIVGLSGTGTNYFAGTTSNRFHGPSFQVETTGSSPVAVITTTGTPSFVLDATQTIDITNASAFLVRQNAGGTDVFKVNTTTPGVTISTLTGILKGTSGLVSVATSGTDYEVPLTFNSPLSRSVNTISLGTVDISSNTNLAATSPIVLTGDTLSFSPAGSSTNFQYNNAGVLGGSSFFNYATDNIPTIGDGNAQATSIGTCTISNASPAVVTKAGHGLAVGDRVRFTSTGSPPSPLHPTDPTDGVQEYYYIISSGFGVNSFQISLTRGGAAINTTTAGSGTHTLWKYVNYQLNFDSNEDALVEWRNDPSFDQWTLSVRRSDDQYFQYPQYAARFAVNATQVTDYESPVAFSAFINAGANTSELYGFWGGVYDQGASAFNVTTQAVGILCYNYLGGSNARTLANVVGGDFTSELGSNITGTNIIGGRFQAAVAATSATFTNGYGIRVLSSVGTLTNNYGINISQMSGATNNYELFFAAAGGSYYRAGTQAIWSSAASTLDITTNTTLNFKIGANPANGTAGTNYMTFKAAGLAPVTTNQIDLGTSSLGWKTLYLDTSAFFNVAAPAIFRATTQSVYSSAASTLDLDTNTTGNLRVGGTVEYIWNASKFDFQANIVDMTAGKAEMPALTALPATCVQGEYVQDTDSNDCANTGGGDGAICVCKTTNTWALVANI